MSRIAALVAVVALALGAGATSGGARTTSPSRAQATCSAGQNYGWMSQNFIATGRPAWLVRTLCAVARQTMKGGYQSGATHLVCGAYMKSYPNALVGVFASRSGIAFTRRWCSRLFSASKGWVRYK